MNELKNLATDFVRRMYGPVAIFEHGPGEECRKVGCGVDHAHLHIVPVDFDLQASAASFLPNDACWQAASFADCQEAARAGDDYIYVEQPLGKGRMLRHRQLGSQLLRRAIAARLGTPDEFDWHTHSKIGNVRATIRAFAANADGPEFVLDVSNSAA